MFASLVNMGLRGQHPLFAPDDIADAMRDAPETDASRGLERAAADAMGRAGRRLMRSRSLAEARTVVSALPPPVRHAVIRAWFRFLAHVPRSAPEKLN